MKVVRNRADLRWLPGRHHYALARLIAFWKLSRSRPEPVPGLVLAIDPDQSAMENYTLSAVVFATAVAFFIAMAAPFVGTAGAILLAPAGVIVTMQSALYVSGMIIAPLIQRVMGRRAPDNIDVTSAVMLAALSALAIWFTREPTPARFVAWCFLGMVAANAVAAVAAWLIRDRIEALEKRCVP